MESAPSPVVDMIILWVIERHSDRRSKKGISGRFSRQSPPALSQPVRIMGVR